jgi:hypothetical protein
MLSDSERRRLAEIESSLRADDPVFVQRFDAHSRPRRRRTVLALLTFVLAVIIVVIALLCGNVVAVVLGLATAAAWPAPTDSAGISAGRSAPCDGLGDRSFAAGRDGGGPAVLAGPPRPPAP